jgi:hypothetical protein
MRFCIIAACTVALLFATSPADAAKRVALVIGNNDYDNVPKLQKAVNDADAISKELAKLGFEVVTAQDVGRRAMSRALVELEGKIGAGDTSISPGTALPSTAPTTFSRSTCRAPDPGKRAW